jgi:hypothetical protein
MENDSKFDLRLIERNLAKGVVTREEYDKLKKGLPDAGKSAENVEASLAERVTKPATYPPPKPKKK